MEDDKTLRSKIITGVSFGVLVFITSKARLELVIIYLRWFSLTGKRKINLGNYNKNKTRRKEKDEKIS